MTDTGACPHALCRRANSAVESLKLSSAEFARLTCCLVSPDLPYVHRQPVGGHTTSSMYLVGWQIWRHQSPWQGHSMRGPWAGAGDSPGAMGHRHSSVSSVGQREQGLFLWGGFIVSVLPYLVVVLGCSTLSPMRNMIRSTLHLDGTIAAINFKLMAAIVPIKLIGVNTCSTTRSAAENSQGGTGFIYPERCSMSLWKDGACVSLGIFLTFNVGAQLLVVVVENMLTPVIIVEGFALDLELATFKIKGKPLNDYDGGDYTQLM